MQIAQKLRIDHFIFSKTDDDNNMQFAHTFPPQVEAKHRIHRQGIKALLSID